MKYITALLLLFLFSCKTKTTEKMIILIGYIQVNPSDVNEFTLDAQALTSVARAEKACFFYSVVVEDAAAGRMLLVERWRDQESLTSHIKIQEAAFLKKWTSRMKVDVLKYDASNERPS